jgi:hypothetical protein
MTPIPIGARVLVRSSELLKKWAANATGVVISHSAVGGSWVYWMDFDKARRDGDGDGPYVAAQFSHADLQLICRPNLIVRVSS